MTDPTHCAVCGDRIWWEESASRSCWLSTMNGPHCREGLHVPEEEPNTENKELRCDYDCSQCHPYGKE